MVPSFSLPPLDRNVVADAAAAIGSHEAETEYIRHVVLMLLSDKANGQ